MVQAIGTPARTNTFGDLADAFSELLSDHILIKAKYILQTGELITAGGFADETTAEASHGSDVILLESSQEETDTRIVSWACQLVKHGLDVWSYRAETQMCWCSWSCRAETQMCWCSWSYSAETQMCWCSWSYRAETQMCWCSWSYRAETDVLVLLVISCRHRCVGALGHIVQRHRCVGALGHIVQRQMCWCSWFTLHSAQHRRFVAIHNIQLPEPLRRNIPACCVLTGCDTVSQLSGHGKTSTWKIFHKHGALLASLGHDALFEATMEQVEEFICRIYLPNINDKSMNEVRYKLFQKDAKHRESNLQNRVRSPITSNAPTIEIRFGIWQTTLRLIFPHQSTVGGTGSLPLPVCTPN